VIVVSDTTPLNYLILINVVDVLPALFNDVYVPTAVLRELTHPKAPLQVREWVLTPPAWLRVVDPISTLPSTARLDPGEAQAISLAKELDIRDLLIDERRGSKIAINEGLFPLPTLAVLERAAERNLLELPSAIEKLLRTTIRIPPEQIAAVLQRDRLRKGS
jgi:predicted nucleic acid-binding protein